MWLKQWRYLLLSLLAIAALTAFAACGDDEKDTGGDTATPGATTPAAGERIPGGDMVVHGNQFDYIDPHQSAFAQDISTQRMLWRGLYQLDAENDQVPSMAADDPEISADGMTYTITLRDGLKWSDGDDLLAEDVVAGIVRTCNPVHAGQYQYLLTAIVGCDDYYIALAGPDEIPGSDDDLEPATIDQAALESAIAAKAIDDTTIEFTLSNPQPTFQMILSLWMTFPSPVHLLPDSNTPFPSGEDPTELAYNGPYMLTEYVPEDHITMVPNPNWAAPEGVSPTLDSLTVRFITDAGIANDAFRNDELQFALADTAVLPSLITEFGEGDQYFKLVQPSTRGLEIQLKDPLLADLEVRLALAQAIDRETLNRVAVNNAHQATTSWMPEFVVGGAATDAYEDIVGFDPVSAKEHLANAGYPDGAGWPGVSFLVGDTGSAKAIAEFLQAEFKKHLNIQMDIEVVDAKTRAARFTGEDFQLYHGGWIQDYPDGENWIVGLFDKPGVGNNHYNCDNQELRDILDEALFNQDAAERAEQLRQINDIIVETVCGIAPYYHESNHYLIKPNVLGMRESMAGVDAFQAGDWNAEAWGFSE